MVSQVGRFESIVKPSFSSVIFFSAFLHFPLKSIADYNQEFFRLPPKSISYARDGPGFGPYTVSLWMSYWIS